MRFWPIFSFLLLSTEASTDALGDNDRASWLGSGGELSTAQVEALEAISPWLNHPQRPIANGAQLQFVFNAGRPTLICAPLKVCVVELESGERVAEEGLHLGDTARWIVTPVVSADKTHLMIKPLVAGLDTSMVIITDRRTYHIHLLSDTNRFMPAISWQYPDQQKRAWLKYQATQAVKNHQNTIPETKQNIAGLNFEYEIGACRGCPWRPLRVYDDDQRVYIQMPSAVARLNDLPILLVESGSVLGLINYRVSKDRYIVDGLFERAWLIAGIGRSRQKLRLDRR